MFPTSSPLRVAPSRQGQAGVDFLIKQIAARVLSMADGTGITRYSYNPIDGAHSLGAGALASVDDPLPNDTITYGFDELGRPVRRAINGVDSAVTFDAGARLGLMGWDIGDHAAD